jgi:hypothetical protein
VHKKTRKEYIPALTDNIRPIHFTKSVVGVVKLLITNPPKMVFTSGMPEPAAKFAKRFTNQAASPVNTFSVSVESLYKYEPRGYNCEDNV